jgi:hypothetical protein
MCYAALDAFLVIKIYINLLEIREITCAVRGVDNLCKNANDVEIINESIRKENALNMFPIVES